MLTQIMIKAFLVGLIGSCSAGPIFMLVMHRSVSRGVVFGILTALGSALVGGMYFAFSLAGVLSVVKNYPLVVHMFELAGGVLLLVMGTKALIGITPVRRKEIIII